MVRHKGRDLALEDRRIALDYEGVVDLRFVVLIDHCKKFGKRIIRWSRRRFERIRKGLRNLKLIFLCTILIGSHHKFLIVVGKPCVDIHKIGHKRRYRTLHCGRIALQHKFVDHSALIELVDD